MSLDRLKQYFGLDPFSRRGKKALGLIAKSLALDPITGNRNELTERIHLPPFKPLLFTAAGIGDMTDQDGYYAGLTERPFVTVEDQAGGEWEYRSAEWGIVRKFPGDEPACPLTSTDARILEAAARLTARLKRNEVLW